MDVKKICWGLCLLTCFGGFAGCSDDEEGFNENVIIRDDFTNTEGEKIDFVLDDVPACIIWRNDSNVTFCYAQYAYEYYFDREYLLEMSDDEILDSLEDPKPTYREVAERIFGTVSNPTVLSVPVAS